MEKEAEGGLEERACVKPLFHQTHEHGASFERAVSDKRSEDKEEKEEDWTEDEDGYASEDYNYISLPNGETDEKKGDHKKEDTKGDLMALEDSPELKELG